MVYIGFFENRRFVDFDKFRESEKKSAEGVDRKTVSVLYTLTEYSE